MPDDIDMFATQRAASRVAARAEIRDVRLFRASVELDRFPSTGSRLGWSLDTDVAVEREEGDDAFILRSKYLVRVVETGHGTAEPELVVDDSQEDSDADENQIVELSFEFAALFGLEMRQGDEPVDDSELQAYAFSTGQFALYPFAREYIYDVTGRLGLPPLTVGVLQLPVHPEPPSA
ncbi:SecB chaperone [Micromonospora globispora]|uniref:SecB chaperone n=1 Tax=Micromonospora globispora TaxID=1450148 RepID=A0A317K6X2_9ACTN|nr:SecB chaperone [Micromonospora globispora]